MAERRDQFETGSSTLLDFWEWVNERHRIWCRRDLGEPKPWTKDVILRDFKFTNVFRELDRGTLALRRMEQHLTDPALILFNTIWYRIFNWHELADAGPFGSPGEFIRYIEARYSRGERLFTGCHMVRGTTGGQPKHIGYLKLLGSLDYEALVNRMGDTIKEAFDVLLTIPYIGDFTAYEMASDLRWSLGMNKDRYEWGNPGNGARRGLRRLGYPPTVESMRWIWDTAPLYMCPEVARHYPMITKVIHDEVQQHGPKKCVSPPFEIREVEHSLCEFDKWSRARTGQGVPRQKYAGAK